MMSSACCAPPTWPALLELRDRHRERRTTCVTSIDDRSPPATGCSSPTPRAECTRSCLEPGKEFHTHRGALAHDDLIGLPDGCVVTSAGGTAYLALRPLLSDYVLSMPRGAQVIYPKDAAQIVAMGDIFPGAKVLEAGAGSGALTCSLLRAVGEHGELHSYEMRARLRRDRPAQRRGVLRRRARRRGRCTWATWPTCAETGFDRIILDMLAPWELLDLVDRALVPAACSIGYVATTPQLSELVEALRERGGYTEPRAWESLVRDWHADGLAVRPDHRMIAHTAFLVTARRARAGGLGAAAPAQAEQGRRGVRRPARRLAASAVRPPRRRTAE